MQKTTFIILSPSYLIRKGIASVLNTMENILIYDELESAMELDLSSPYHIPDFFVIDMKSLNNNDLKHINDYIEKFNIDTINLNSDATQKKLPNCKACLELYENEEDLKNKLLICINSSDNNTLDNKKNQTISDREKAVLQLIAKGFTNKEIGDKLFISLHTVITHRKNITKKLGIKTVSGLTVYAILNNLIELKDIEQ